MTTTRTEHGATNHPARFDKIEMLTDRVLNWLGMTYASDYRLRPSAMSVAIVLHDMGVETDTLTKEDLNRALKGSDVLAFWEACQTPQRRAAVFATITTVAAPIPSITVKPWLKDVADSMEDNDECPDDNENGCEGHESLDGAHMGETVYCDGTCS